MASGYGYVFVRPFDVLGAGHVGWGFLRRVESGVNMFCYGATEGNGANAFIPAGGNNGFWRAYGTFAQMKEKMRIGVTAGYLKYKRIAVSTRHGADAYTEATRTRDAGYTLLGNNCMDHSYRILSAYGAFLVPPVVTVTPNLWYMTLPGTEFQL